MAISAEQLRGVREDIANAVKAIESGDTIKVSDKGHSVLHQVRSLDDKAWQELAETYDSVLREQLLTIRKDRSKIEVVGPPGLLARVGHKTSFNVDDRSLMVELAFQRTGDEQWYQTFQDLEDTLWIGMSVVKVVADALEKIQITLGAEAQEKCIGQAFGKNLQEVEDAVREIRQRYQAISEPDRGHQDKQ